MTKIKFLLLTAALVVTAGCSSAPKEKRIKIGFAMDTLKEERWQRDKDLVEKRAKELGMQVNVQVANGDDNQQIKQAENLLTQGVDVLIVEGGDEKHIDSLLKIVQRVKHPH